MKTIRIILATIILTCGINTVNAQAPAAAPSLPIDKTSNNIVYTKVNDVAATSKDELYSRALSWYNTFYKNPTDVIRKKDPESGEIMGISRFKVFSTDEKGVKSEGGLVNYTIKVMCKDNKYKYEITDLNWKQPSKYPIEKWMDASAPSYKPVFASYLAQTDETVKEVIRDLEKAMATAPVKKATDW